MMPRLFGELAFTPSISELEQMQRDRKVTILTGYNNTGKSAYLKKFAERDDVLYIGPSRFYSFHYMSPYNDNPDELRQLRHNFTLQRSQQFTNFEGSYYNANSSLARL